MTGLQNMINLSNNYIRSHGVHFNPLKTECATFGQITLSPNPVWSLENVKLSVTEHVKYLGVTLSTTSENIHVKDRVQACRRAYYALQGAGFNNTNTHANVISYVWNSAIRPVLTYGVNCLPISKKYLNDMEKCQSMVLKSGLGLHKYCKSTPLLKAVNVHRIKTTLDITSLDLVKSIFNNVSRARTFYTHLLCRQERGELKGHKNLLTRARDICCTNNVSLFRFLFDKRYSSTVRNNFKNVYKVPDGLSDSVSQCLLSNDPYNRNVLNLLLMSF